MGLPIITSLKEKEYVLPFVLLGLAAGAQSAVVQSVTTREEYVVEIIMCFPDDAINNVEVYWLSSDSPDISTSTISTGENLLADWISPARIIGHAETIRLACNVPVPASARYVKMHVVNNNTYVVDIQGFVKLRVVG